MSCSYKSRLLTDAGRWLDAVRSCRAIIWPARTRVGVRKSSQWWERAGFSLLSLVDSVVHALTRFQSIIQRNLPFLLLFLNVKLFKGPISFPFLFPYCCCPFNSFLYFFFFNYNVPPTSFHAYTPPHLTSPHHTMRYYLRRIRYDFKSD